MRSRRAGASCRGRGSQRCRDRPPDSRHEIFLASLEGLSDAEVERAVLPFPSHEVDPYRGLSPHFEVASARARAMHALTQGTARIVVTSAAGLMPRVSAPQHVTSTSLSIVPGQQISPIDLGDLLAAAGYTRQDPVDQSGEFCVRGGVVDFFPAGAAQPIRVEFVGDDVESIRHYDPETQRSTGEIDQALFRSRICWLTRMERQDRSATAFDYLWARPATRPGLGTRRSARARREADRAGAREL